MKRKVFSIAVIIISIFIIVFLVWIFISFSSPYSPEAPVFFSLNDTHASYSIDKLGGDKPNQLPLYLVVHKLPQYKREGDEIFVGTSKIPLNPYVGKNIVIDGYYSGKVSNVQCIVNMCQRFAGPQAVIDINSIQMVK